MLRSLRLLYASVDKVWLEHFDLIKPHPYIRFFFFFDRQKSKRYIKKPKKATPSTQEIYMCAPNKKEKNENPPLIGNLTLISVICLVLMDLKPIILMPLKP